MIYVVFDGTIEDGNLFRHCKKIIKDGFDENKDVERRAKESNYYNELENNNLLEKKYLESNFLHLKMDYEYES